MLAKSINMTYQVKTILLAVTLGLLLDGCRTVHATYPVINAALNRADNLALGNPSDA